MLLLIARREQRHAGNVVSSFGKIKRDTQRCRRTCALDCGLPLMAFSGSCIHGTHTPDQQPVRASGERRIAYPFRASIASGAAIRTGVFCIAAASVLSAFSAYARAHVQAATPARLSGSFMRLQHKIATLPVRLTTTTRRRTPAQKGASHAKHGCPARDTPDRR